MYFSQSNLFHGKIEIIGEGEFFINIRITGIVGKMTKKEWNKFEEKALNMVKVKNKKLLTEWFDTLKHVKKL